MDSKRKYIPWVDMAKGIGVMLVIMGHINFRPEQLNVWLCSFHMPLFFLLAGYTYNVEKYRNFRTLLFGKVKSILIPYFLFAGITWLWRLTEGVISCIRSAAPINWTYLLKQLSGIVLQIRGTDYGIGVWFLPCIFVAFFLLWAIESLPKYWRTVAATVSLVIGYLYCEFVGIRLPWGIDAALVAVFFMHLGVLLREKTFGIKQTKYRVAVTCVWGGVNLIAAYLNYRVLHRTVGMWSNNYGNILWFVIGALSGVAFIICLCRLYSNKWICKIGKNSIYYYGLHILLVEIIDRYLPRFVNVSNVYVAFACTVLVMVAVLVIMTLCYPLYERIYRFIMRILSKKPMKLQN